MGLTQEEKEIIDYVETKNPKSINNVTNEIAKYTNLAKNYIKKENIQIEIPKTDLYLLKRKALEEGIDYKNIIQLLVHKYIYSNLKIEI